LTVPSTKEAAPPIVDGAAWSYRVAESARDLELPDGYAIGEALKLVKTEHQDRAVVAQLGIAKRDGAHLVKGHLNATKAVG
jgi:hypothetical protein